MRRLFSALVILAWIQTATAVELLNARFFPQEHLQIQTQWLEPELRGAKNRDRENLLIASSSLSELRLTIPQQYIGSSHKVYLVMPNQFAGIRDHGVEIRWETRGRFFPDTAKPGQRILLYEGLISDSVLWDEIVFTFTIDARYIYGPMEFHPHYEIE